MHTQESKKNNEDALITAEGVVNPEKTRPRVTAPFTHLTLSALIQGGVLLLDPGAEMSLGSKEELGLVAGNSRHIDFWLINKVNLLWMDCVMRLCPPCH